MAEIEATIQGTDDTIFDELSEEAQIELTDGKGEDDEQ